MNDTELRTRRNQLANQIYRGRIDDVWIESGSIVIAINDSKGQRRLAVAEITPDQIEDQFEEQDFRAQEAKEFDI